MHSFSDQQINDYIMKMLFMFKLLKQSVFFHILIILLFLIFLFLIFS